MSKYKIVNLFDKLFITCTIFLIIYAWINFFIRDLISTFILSLIFSSGITFLIFYLFNKKNEKMLNNKKLLKVIETNFLAFRLLSKTEQLSLINSIVEKKFKTRILSNGIAFKKDNKTGIILIATQFEKISEYDFVNLLQGISSVDFIEIICNDFDEKLNTKILNNININFVTKKQLYNEYFLKNLIFPNCEKLNIKIERKSFRQIAKYFFVPAKAKSYFICGLILIFSSIILPYQTYYLIFGSVLLIFSIICKLQPFFKR